MICKKILQVASNEINSVVTFNFDTNTNKIVLVSQDNGDRKVLPLGEMKDENDPTVNITLTAGTGITIGNDDSININTEWLDGVIDGKGFAVLSAVPTKVSDLPNDAGYVSTDTTYTQGTGVTISGEQNIVAINQEWLEGFVANLGYVKVENDQVCSADETTIVMTGNRVLSVNATWLDNVIDAKGFAQASAVAAIADQISTFALKSELPTIPTGLSQFENDANYAKIDDIPSIPTGLSYFTNDTGYLVQDNLSSYAPISTIPSIDGLASEEYVDGKLSGYLKVEDYNDTDTTYTAGLGLKLDGTEFSLTAAIPSIEGLASESYVNTKLEDYLRVEDYFDTDTTYTAGEGLSLSGNEFSLTAAIPTKVSDLVNDLGFTTEDSFLKEAAYVKAFVSGDTTVEIGADMTELQIYAAKEAIGVIDAEVTTGAQLAEKYGNRFGRFLKLVFATKNNAGTETNSNAIYIDVNELFDSYTGGEGIAVDQDTNTISLTAAIPTVPTKVSEFVNDKGFVTLNDLEQVKTTLLEYMNPSNVVTYESIDGNVSAPGKSIYIEQEDTLTANTTFEGKNITVQELNSENSYTKFTATGDVTLSNMDNSGTLPKAQSNGQVLINTPGRVVITNSDLNQNGYNCIEIGLTNSIEPPKSVLIDSITFGGNLSNNCISIYGTANDAIITISNCTFTKVSNALRLSNRTNASGIVINFVNCEFTEWESFADYAGAVICQDYTSTTAEAAEANNLFGDGKIAVNFINCTHAGNAITFDDPATVCGSKDANQILYVYRDKGGLVAYDPAKYPVVSC